VAIEWAERLPYRPESYVSIKLSYAADGGRSVTIEIVGDVKIELANLQSIVEPSIVEPSIVDR
jgi:tRNA threonylcarbamoyladenosine biosynthesis protein TsaE